VAWATELKVYFPHAAIVADIRGAWPEEALLKRGFASLEDADEDAARDYALHVQALRKAIAEASQVLTVSPGMIEWLEGLGICSDQVSHVPCCVPAVTYDAVARQSARRRLGVENRRVFAYVGTITPYQSVGDGALRFVAIARKADERTHFLAVTSDPQGMRELLRASDIPDEGATVLRVSHQDVAGNLVAADAGLLIREPTLVNRCSSPVKLGEYLASGLPVIISHGFGHLDNLIEHAGAGVTVELFRCDDGWVAAEAARVHRMLDEQGECMRDSALQLCTTHFLWSCYIGQVRSVYQRALGA
jgi:glycosyltransferase involved in cell wall biosynthesis